MHETGQALETDFKLSKWTSQRPLALHEPPSVHVGQKYNETTIATVFVDTRLWKTKYPWPRFRNFRQFYLLSTDRIEIHQ